MDQPTGWEALTPTYAPPDRGEKEMTMKMENLKMHPFNTTLMGVVQGVLDYYRIATSPAMAFGGSGHAFLINIHEQICPSGPYCWKYDRFYELVRNLGLEMTDLGFFHKGSSPAERSAVEARLKAALDQGVACSLCNMENQLITGYDDTKFFTARPWECPNEFPPATLTFGSWKEMGDEVHVNFFAFRKVSARDGGEVIRDSLSYAVDLFRTPRNYSNEHYGIGPEAYDNWIKAAAEFGSSHGNWWNATVWSECRSMAADYFSEIAARLPGVAVEARELSSAYRDNAGLLERVSNKELDAGGKVHILTQLKERELAAIEKVERLVGRL